MSSVFKIAIVKSEFNEEVVNGLLDGACQTLREAGINQPEIFSAPGAFELPLIAKAIIETKHFDGVICLGCVVKGDTAHFEFISLGATLGIQMTSLETRTPVSFGVITTYTDQQAIDRSKKDEHNKGREAALAVLASIKTLAQIRGQVTF